MIAAVICVRADSTRLPGKVLEDIGGRTVLASIASRLRRASSVTSIIVATSEEQSDNAIAVEAARLNLPCYRGSKNDVVARMDGAVRRYAAGFKYVFRAMSDQPFLDWACLDEAARLMEIKGWDVVLPLSFGKDPVYGAGLSPWSKRAWSAIVADSRGDEREHVGMWLRRNLKKFEYGLLDLPHWCFRPYRLELDTEDDLRLVRGIVATKAGDISLRSVVALLDKTPELVATNATYTEKTGTYTSYTVAEVAEWERDYRGREVVFSDMPSLEADLRAGQTRATRCQTCGGLLMPTKVRDGDLKLKCTRCGRGETFYADKRLDISEHR